MDQTQTRQTAAPPSHPSLLPLPHLSILIVLSISLPVSSHIPSLSFSLFTLILSILCLLNGWSTCENENEKREVLDNIKRRNWLNNRAKKNRMEIQIYIFQWSNYFSLLISLIYKTKTEYSHLVVCRHLALSIPSLHAVSTLPTFFHPPHSFSNLPSSTLIYPASPEANLYANK